MRKKKLYDGKNFSISLYYMNIEGQKIKQEIIEQNRAVAILAFEGKNVILVKQFRFPCGYVHEIPAGVVKKNETPIDCAFREFEEETGYRAKKMTYLMTAYPSIGYNLQFIDYYVAKGIKKTKELKLDKEEFLTVVKMDFNKLLKMIKSGKIIESRTICAALTYAAKITFNAKK